MVTTSMEQNIWRDHHASSLSRLVTRCDKCHAEKMSKWIAWEVNKYPRIPTLQLRSVHRQQPGPPWPSSSSPHRSFWIFFAFCLREPLWRAKVTAAMITAAQNCLGSEDVYNLIIIMKGYEWISFIKGSDDSDVLYLMVLIYTGH